MNKVNVSTTAITVAIPTAIEVLVLILRIPLCTAASPPLVGGLLGIGIIWVVGGGDLKSGYDANLLLAAASWCYCLD